MSHGVGGSNSVFAVMDVESGEFIAEFADPYTSTYDLADEIVLSARTVFSNNGVPCFVGWESNGPGADFYRDFWRHDFGAVFFQRAVGTKREKRSKVYGWQSTRKTKRILLSGLSRAIQRGEVVIHSEAGLKEMTTYVFFETGEIGPAVLEDELTGAREQHGDRVVAYAGCVFLRGEVAKFDIGEPSEIEDRPGTFGRFLDMGKTFRDIKAGKYLRG